MPSSGHVVHNDKERRGVSGRRRKAEGRGRKAIALDINNQGGSYLNPGQLLASFSGMGIKYREYLPSSPSSPGKAAAGVGGMAEQGSSSWQECDLGDGHGRRPLLVITSPHHALQIFSIKSSTIPDDPHVQETHPAPKEILSLSSLQYDAQAGAAGGSKSREDDDARVICARLMDKGPICGIYGPVALLITASGQVGTEPRHLSLSVMSLRTSLVVKQVDLGMGNKATLAVSPRILVIGISRPSASVLILDPHSLEVMHPPIEHLPIDSRSSLPVFALSGRLLAYTTLDTPRQPGPENLGTIVTARTLATRSNSRRKSDHPHSKLQAQRSAEPMSNGSGQGAILTSAVELGGVAARGVWAGLKLGAQAAGRAANQRLASSAPARSGLEEVSRDDATARAISESRSFGESSHMDMDDTQPVEQSDTAGQWVKVVDLCAGGAANSTKTIAHFRLPRSKPLVSPSGSDTTQSRIISFLAFSPSGTSLFIAPRDGRVFHVVDLHPAGPDRILGQPGVEGEVYGEVWHMYELRRGSTAAAVSEVKWSLDGRWIGVATQRGTVHVFAINPFGGPTSATTHLPIKLPNPINLSSLSTIITPSARLRTRLCKPNESFPDPDLGATFTFLPYRRHPLQGVSCLDTALFRPALGQVDLARLSVKMVQSTKPELEVTRRASALTEMMKAKVGLAASDLGVESGIKATWQMPLAVEGTDEDLSLHLVKVEDKNCMVVRPPKRYRANIEIQTFSHNPHLLPGTIYQSHQVDFYSAAPIDDYSRLSIIDREARTRRLHFRPEIEIHSSTPDSKSFDEPLISALHSVIESSPTSQIPGLPNGRGHYSNGGVGQWKASIPIRTVKQGAAHLRREYVRRASLSKRSVHDHDRTGLSFEDDTVFASSLDQDQEEVGDDHSNSSALSSGIPNTDTDPDPGPHELGHEDGEEEGEGDEDWGVKWEDEYERAVLDDGGPDDLVLGLMDEQEEERKRWVMRQKKLAEEYAKGQHQHQRQR